MKDKPDRKQKQKEQIMLTTCKNRLSVYVDEERLESFMTEVHIIHKPANDLQKSMDWFLYDKNLRHERVNALLLACIH